MKNKMQSSETGVFAQIQKLTTELTQTRTYLQSKEEEVVMLRKDISKAQSQQEEMKEQFKGEEVAIANKELE